MAPGPCYLFGTCGWIYDPRMMRHPMVFRLAAGAFALWLALVLADAPALDRCPMHDGPGAGGSARGHAPSSMAGMGMAGMPMAGSGGAPGAPGAQPGSPPAHVHGCTCLGACSAGVAVLVTLPPPAVATIPSRPAPSLAPPSATPLRGTASHFLPFAQAPPALA